MPISTLPNTVNRRTDEAVSAFKTAGSILRVSSLPSQFGEKVVIRLLDNSMSLADLDRLAMEEDLLPSFQTDVEQPARSCAEWFRFHRQRKIDDPLCCVEPPENIPTKNIITVENPIEYQMAGVTQVQLSPRPA